MIEGLERLAAAGLAATGEVAHRDFRLGIEGDSQRVRVGCGLDAGLLDVGDRVFPGEGDFRLRPIVDRLRAIQYAGWVSLELFNPMLWKAKPTQIAELGRTAMERVLGTL